MIRILSAWILLLGLLSSAPAWAAQPTLTRAQALKAITQAAPIARRAGVERLGDVGTMADADRLVERLSDTDAEVRDLAATAMWKIWGRANDRAIDALYEKGIAQMSQQNLTEALATFSQIIERKPAFAEGWNKRATIRYLMGDYEQSLKDCDEVIKRNPNHFGALSGYAQIYVQLGDFEHAIEYFERALEVNPNLAAAAMAIEFLKPQLEERRRKAI